MIPREEAPIGISKLKKDDLMVLSKAMPQTRTSFYENLVISESPDIEDNYIM